MGKFEKGDKVLARIDGSWQLCIVEEVKSETMKVRHLASGDPYIHFHGHFREYDEAEHERAIKAEMEQKRLYGSGRFSEEVMQMEQSIIDALSELDQGYGYRKSSISEKTGIPEDILTVILKRLKQAERVELIMIFSEYTGMADGSGYALTGKGKRSI